MATNQVSTSIHDHGTALDEQKKRVRCNYCAKVVSGFSRLKQHLGGIRGDVVPCLEVPEDVKIPMRNSLLEKKNTLLSREVVQLFHSEAPSKENSCANSDKINPSQHESIHSPATGKRKNTAAESRSKRRAEGDNMFAHKMVHSQRTANNEDAEKDSMDYTQRCIARFFYENDIDFHSVESPCFREMIKAIVELGSAGIKVPNCNELNGWILQEEKEEVDNYVRKVRQSWGSTGCSILLDGWTDKRGRSLINFLVDCPLGPMYLRSADISDSSEDVNSLMLMLDGVIEEVGVQNVVQVITYNTSSFMEAVGKQLIEKYRTIFWSACASHCIVLMVETIGTMDPFSKVLCNAKAIVELIYTNVRLLQLFRKRADGRDLVYSSGIRSLAPFLTLEAIVAEEETLKSLFGSSVWKTSTSASTIDGKRVTHLVEEPSFWDEASVVLKAIIPLVRAVNLISGGDNRPQMGFIYETMDQAKETIKKGFKNKKAKYMPYWKVIDGIWDNQLHSPLHSAGYFLNPSLFYSPDFYSDAEVASGLLCCIVRMVEDREVQDLITLQLDEYRAANGSFGHAMTINQRTKVAPAKWWSLYGGQCPELQRVAIRILSQTCSGGLKYDLKRSLSEKLHASGMDGIEQQQMKDLAFFRHNLQLRHSCSVGTRDDDQIVEDIIPVNDRVVEVQEVSLQDDDDIIAFMRSDQAFVSGEGPSSFQPKDEPV